MKKNSTIERHNSVLPQIAVVAPASRDLSHSAPQDWVPESAVRDALFSGKLPSGYGDRNLFWINIRQYLTHAHAQLPPDEYLRHWREVYRSFVASNTGWLRALSYLRLERPQNSVRVN